MSKIWPIQSLVFAAVAFAVAQTEEGIQFKGAQVFTEFGSIVKGVDLAVNELDNMWVQRFGGTFDLEAHRGDHLSLYFGAGSVFWHAIPVITTVTASKVFYGDAILTKAYAQFNFGDEDETSIRGKLGFFPVKYSRSRNLGEYLFRTGTYPNFIVTGNGYTAVNTSSATLLGTQWTQTFASGFSHDLFFTSERQSNPLHDFSLTYLAKYQGGLLNAGLGLQLDRVIPVVPSSTTPTASKNTWFSYEGRDIANNPEYYQYLRDGANLAGDSAAGAAWAAEAALIENLQAQWEADPATQPTLNQYTFKGIKPLAMLSLDFKSLFDEDTFRKEEMLLYTEAVIMGWADQPVYYENRMDRLAVMVGFNFPTFGLLDQCNLELERWTSPYINGYRTAREGNMPWPDYTYFFQGYQPDDWSSDDLKWSVFLGKEILGGFNIQTQIASDHLRGRRNNRVVSENSLLFEDSHWYYAIKLQASL